MLVEWVGLGKLGMDRTCRCSTEDGSERDERAQEASSCGIRGNSVRHAEYVPRLMKDVKKRVILR